MNDTRYISFFNEASLSVKDIYENKCSITDDKDTDTTESDDDFGFMTRDQLEYIRKENAKYKIQNVIHMNEELDKILEDISGSVETIDRDFHAEPFNDFTKYQDELNPLIDSTKLVHIKIPNGIILDQTIPISSVRLVREIDKLLMVDDDEGRHVIKSAATNITDVRIYTDNLKHHLSKMHDENYDGDELVVIGSVEFRILDNRTGIETDVNMVPLITSVNRHTIEIDRFHMGISSKDYKSHPSYYYDFDDYKKNYLAYANEIAYSVITDLILWHGIQLAMLNPMIKECLCDNERVPLSKGVQSKNKKSNKKKPVRYVRRITININDIKDVLYRKDSHGNYTRKTLIWYVAGHWVHRNGKRFFRKGHWKGVLRNNPEYVNSEPRERELVTTESEV